MEEKEGRQRNPGTGEESGGEEKKKERTLQGIQSL